MRNCITLMVVGMLPAPSLFAQVPRGYRVVQLTDNEFREASPRVSDRGEVVFMRRLVPGLRSSQEIFLVNVDGELIRLTDDNIQDVGPDINSDGVITWARGLGPINPDTGEPTLEIVVRSPDGVVTRLTDNAMQESGPRINLRGQVVWDRIVGEACNGAKARDIYLFNGSEVIPITTDAIPESVGNQSAVISDRAEITWTRYNDCDVPWTSKIMLYSDGETVELTDSQLNPQVPDINNHSIVTWFHSAPPSFQDEIEIWENGETTTLTDWGVGSRINDAGLVTFGRWYAQTGQWHQWLYRDGEFFNVSEGFDRNLRGDLNSVGEIVWQSGPSGSSDIIMMKRFARGDLNCDGSIDAFDIEPFLLALFDVQLYSIRYPRCDFALGDLNDDGSVNAFDIEPFVDLLFP